MQTRTDFKDIIQKIQLNHIDFLDLYSREFKIGDDFVRLNNPRAVCPLYQMTDETHQIFCNALVQNTSLKSIHFESSIFYSKVEHAKTIGLVLKDHPSLEEISIELVQIELDGIIGILQCLTGCAPIKSVRLGIYQYIDEDFMNRLGNIFSKNKSLKMFCIELFSVNRFIYNINLNEFGKGLSQIPTLEKLYIKSFPITSSNVEGWLTHLKEVNTLRTLSLEDIHIGYNDRSISLLSEMLKKNQKLKTLRLRSIYFSKESFKSFLESLLFLPHLKKLALFDFAIKNVRTLGIEDIIPLTQLRIENLFLGNYMSYSSSLIKGLIQQNIYLKNLRFEELDEVVVRGCIPLFSNPKQCQLRMLQFHGSFSGETYHQLIKAMHDNHHLAIYTTYSTKFSINLVDVRNKNVNHTKDVFFRKLQEFSNVCHSRTTASKSWSSLPLTIIFIILKMVWHKKDVYMTTHDLLFYHALHLQNFSIRRRLINEKKYDPKSNKVSRWWFGEIKSKNEIDTYIACQSVIRHGFFNQLAQSVTEVLEVKRLFGK